jgi:RNA polymerase sigma-70 factor (ECF subfamily)
MPDRHDDVVRRLAQACRRGDIVTLRAALHADAVAVCDSGGLVPAPTGPVHGAEDVAQLVAVLLCGQPDTQLTIEAVNGSIGLALRRAGQAIAVVAVLEADARAAVLWIMLNPAKLHRWHSAWPATG